MRQSWALIVSVVGVTVLGIAQRAGAAHLVEGDVRVDQQVPTQAEQIPDPSSSCISTGSVFGKGPGFTDTSAFVDVGSDASLSGSGCGMLHPMTARAASLTAFLTADPGDSGPVTLCFTARYDLSAESTAGFTATSKLGDSMIPVTGAATITRSPGAITIFTAGPIAINSGESQDAQSGVFTANPGDMISLRAGVSTDVAGTGTGSGTAVASAFLSIKIGSCVGEGAPPLSHTGLAALAALLGGLGVWTVARRSLTRRIGG
jgi:hypothetical protein